ncbi:MAG: clostripain-related cysteine peptidase [Candidatus Cohnella colombiensis]|uniref:Clostripain-related cysteine peptidase n=1 Tax=Candidatus Cohnella colombiensis TaxID=3121368 RepID=A0AA95JCY5_9BACL|nr:MAG: clostripain-related cysteine peptidase [Cohnella sp.]
MAASKKTWYILGILGLLLVGFLFLLGDSEEGASNELSPSEIVANDKDSGKNAPKEIDSNLPGYTVLVYMNGSDLESTWDEEYEVFSGAASTDLEEMMNGLSGDDVQVIVETGGTLNWAYPEISGEQNQRWMVNEGGLTNLADVGAKNMGDSQTLADFVTWGVENYPANNYALIFWNHGGGSVLGFGSDELFDGDSLTLDEIGAGLAAAYEKTSKKLDLIGFDACLMATVETAYQLSPYAEYMIASQELEPGHGWDYTGALNYLSNEPYASGAEFGKAIVNTYKEHAIVFGEEKSITLSVIDLDKVPAVVQALEALVKEAGPIITADNKRFYSFAEGRSKAEDYGSTTAHGGITDMADLASIAKNVSSQYPDTADALQNAIHSAVVYNMNSIGRPDASGLSIYFPHKDKGNFDNNLSVYTGIGFSEIYVDFLNRYISRLTGVKSGVSIEKSNKEEFSFQYGSDESDIFEVQLNPDDLERIEQIYGVVAMLPEGSDGPMVYLGYDHYVNMDWETGLLQDDFSGEWLTWDGNFVSLFMVSQGEGYIRYAIPAILNGKEVDIIVHFDIESGEFEVLGAWRGIGEKTGMPDKNMLKISAGEEIIPLYYYDDNDEATEDEEYTRGEAFIVGKDKDLYYDVLPNGSYLYGFSIIDYSGNETYSDFVEILLEE